MRTPLVFLFGGVVAILAGCATSTPPQTATASSQAKATQLNEARLAEAQLLANERRFGEAAAIYEEQIQLLPQDGDLFARYASMLSKQANAEVDPAKAKSLNKHARALAEKAEKFGTTNPMPPILLASIRPDGTTVETPKGTFSNHAEVEQLIRDGETAYRQNNLTKARECYQKAFDLEPTNYMAALWTGDAYFSALEMEPACEWFRKAIAIDPDRETAHRYLGDALAKRGKPDEALDEYIAALLCEPYQRTTRQHFTPRLRAQAEAQGHTIPRFPEGRYTIDVAKKEIAIDSSEDAIAAIYSMACATWRMSKFAEVFPNEKEPRRSLPEELAGLELLIAYGEKGERDDKETDAAQQEMLKKWQPVAHDLAALKKSGLLEAHVFFERADKGLAKDYAAYRTGHREQLERYIRMYWCGLK